MAPDVGQRLLDDANHLDTSRPGDGIRKPFVHDQLELAPLSDLSVQFDDRLNGADQRTLPDALEPQVVDGVAQASDRPPQSLYLPSYLSGAVHALGHRPEDLQDDVVQLAGYPAALGLPDLAPGLLGPPALCNVLQGALVTRDTSFGVIDGACVGRDPHRFSVFTEHPHLEASCKTLPQRYLVELLPAFRLCVELVPDIGDGPEHLLGRLVAEDPCHRGISRQEPSVDRGLEDSFDSVLEDRTVLLLCLPALATYVCLSELPLDGAVEPGEVVLHKVVVGSGFHGRDGGVLADLTAHDDERQVHKTLAPEQPERGRRAEGRHAMVGDDEVPTAPVERGLHGRRGVDPLPGGVVSAPAQAPHQECGIVLGVLDEQYS